MLDFGIRCQWLMTMKNGKADVLNDYFIGVQGSVIKIVEPFENQKANKNLHFQNQLVMPGLINGHTHLPMTLFRGLADDEPFEKWLFQTIVPLESKIVDADFVKVGTELAVAECIRFGVTSVCDMYFFTTEIADVLDRFGLRGLVAEGILDFPTPDNKGDLSKSFWYLDQLSERYSAHDRVSVAVGPHAPYTCSDETLIKAKAYANKRNLPLVVHMAETKNEVENSLSQFHMTPVERFHHLGLFECPTICAHGVHLTEKDMSILAKTKTSVIYNPESNMKLGAGTTSIGRLLNAGITVGLGTDGAASNNNLNLFHEMDTGAKLQKVSQHNNTAMTAEQALVMATLGGAKALGLDSKIGSIEVGKFADLIAVDFTHPHMQPIHNFASQLVYSATGLEVSWVMCHGKTLFADGKHLTLDLQNIYQRANEYKHKIFSISLI